MPRAVPNDTNYDKVKICGKVFPTASPICHPSFGVNDFVRWCYSSDHMYSTLRNHKTRRELAKSMLLPHITMHNRIFFSLSLSLSLSLYLSIYLSISLSLSLSLSTELKRFRDSETQVHLTTMDHLWFFRGYAKP